MAYHLFKKNFTNIFTIHIPLTRTLEKPPQHQNTSIQQQTFRIISINTCEALSLEKTQNETIKHIKQ